MRLPIRQEPHISTIIRNFQTCLEKMQGQTLSLHYDRIGDLEKSFIVLTSGGFSKQV